MQPQNPITYFAETDARNRKMKFGIKETDRLRHVYVIGKTGMGKSTLLENMAIQDIQNGNGLCFIDPHGGTADKLLEYVPEHRIKDVLYFAPFDVEYPVAFNVMEDIGAEKRHLVLSGLMSAFKKLFGEESFSDRMQYILQNTILALLEYPGTTMLGINRMLAEKDYRNKVIANITDPSVKNYWVKEYAGYTERFAAEAIPAIQNKIGQFTSNPLIRNIIGQSKSSFDIRKIMDEKKILIVNMSKGQVGEGNANLLGSMLITKIYLAAMSRADLSTVDVNRLPSFYLYVDEFQSFANKSFADILSEARKYKLNLTIAHQYIEQMEEEVRDAVFGNVGTMITFRVGAFDAEVLEKEFAPVFTAEDLVNLGKYQLYLKLMIDGVSSLPFSAVTMPPIPAPAISYKREVIESSRRLFAQPRAQAEAEIISFHEVTLPSAGAARPALEPIIGPDHELPAGKKSEARDMRQEARGDIRHTNQNQSQNNGPFERAFAQSRPAEPNSQKPEVKAEVDQNKMAFAAAARELEKQSGNQRIENRESKIEEKKPEAKQERQESDNRREEKNRFSENPNQAKKVSLSDLRPEHEKAKIPTTQNMNGLKAALAGVIKQSQEGKEKSHETRGMRHEGMQIPGDRSQETEEKKSEENPERQETRDKRQEEIPKQNREKNTSTSAERIVGQSRPKEIPEDVLRRVLYMEEPKIPEARE